MYFLLVSDRPFDALKTFINGQHSKVSFYYGRLSVKIKGLPDEGIDFAIF